MTTTAQKRVIWEMKTYADRIVVVSGYTSADGRGPIGLFYRVTFLKDGEITEEGFGGCLGGYDDFAEAKYQTRAVILINAPVPEEDAGRYEFFPFWGKARSQP